MHRRIIKATPKNIRISGGVLSAIAGPHILVSMGVPPNHESIVPGNRLCLFLNNLHFLGSLPDSPNA